MTHKAKARLSQKFYSAVHKARRVAKAIDETVYIIYDPDQSATPWKVCSLETLVTFYQDRDPDAAIEPDGSADIHFTYTAATNQL